MTETADQQEIMNKILKQVEYYFSDSNYIRDKHLLEEAKKNPEKYIEIEKIASFNRMKSITTDLKLVSETLKKSDKLQVSEDGKMVRRVDPIPESEDSTKVLYSKGWPTDSTTIEKVEEFFKPYGKVLSVRFRKNKDKSFKGSLFVDFEGAEIVQKIITENPALSETQPLHYLTFDQFNDEKKQEREKYLNSHKRKSMDGEAKDSSEESSRQQQKVEEKEEPKAIEMVPGCIVSFTVGPTHRSDLQTYFGTVGAVAHVQYTQGETKGLVRFQNAEEAKSALEKLEAEKKEIGGVASTYALLTGDDEKQEWDNIITFTQRAAKGKGRGGKRGGRGGRGRGGKKH